jgi:starch phosphorylase
VLAGFSSERFDDLARDAALRARVDSAFRELRDYLGAARTWGSVHAGPLRVRPVAYFSAEFGHPRIAARVFGRPRRARG